MIRRFDPPDPKLALRRVLPRGPKTAAGRVLVGDAEDCPQTILADVLRGDGYDVRETREAAELVRLAAAWHPHLVIADSRMDVVADLRAGGERAPVIVIVGEHAGPPEAAAGDVAAVFSEPLDVDNVRTAVLNLAASKQAAHAIARPHVSSAVEAALSRCIFVLRDVAADRAHPLMAASALHGLRSALDGLPGPSATQERAAEALADAYVRFEDARTRGSEVIARYELELATLAVLESGGWRR